MTVDIASFKRHRGVMKLYEHLAADVAGDEYEALWRSLVEAEMSHRGYSDDEIQAASATEHAAECEYEANTCHWMCENGDGQSYHPAADEYDEISQIIGRVLEALGSDPS